MSENRFGPLVFSEPRAVKIRNPQNIKEIHSAVHSSINIEVDTSEEANMILNDWDDIMYLCSEIIEDKLRTFRNKVEPANE